MTMQEIENTLLIFEISPSVSGADLVCSQLFGVTNAHVFTAPSLGLLEYLE